MQVDITVNNILAIVNTKLLADYVKLDERLLQLCCIVKHWAKRRQACPFAQSSCLFDVNERMIHSVHEHVCGCPAQGTSIGRLGRG